MLGFYVVAWRRVLILMTKPDGWTSGRCAPNERLQVPASVLLSGRSRVSAWWWPWDVGEGAMGMEMMPDESGGGNRRSRETTSSSEW